MQRISKGFTNQSFKDGQNFFQAKNHNNFNHKINYDQLALFDFVPKLINNNEQSIRWEWIEGHEPKINEINLRKIASQLKVIHNSKLSFPSSNHSARVKYYIKKINEKNLKISTINQYYKLICKILKNMDKTTPLHNDLWLMNMIETKDRIFFVDWEYATKGDKHFDLAYFIESSKLTKEQESVFLEEYEDFTPKYLLFHKVLVNYLVILWNNAQEIKHFEDDQFIKKIEVLVKEINDFKDN